MGQYSVKIGMSYREFMERLKEKGCLDSLLLCEYVDRLLVKRDDIEAWRGVKSHLSDFFMSFHPIVIDDIMSNKIPPHSSERMVGELGWMKALASNMLVSYNKIGHITEDKYPRILDSILKNLWEARVEFCKASTIFIDLHEKASNG